MGTILALLAMELVPLRTICVSWAGARVKAPGTLRGAVKPLGDVLCCPEVLVPPQ